MSPQLSYFWCLTCEYYNKYFPCIMWILIFQLEDGINLLFLFTAWDVESCLTTSLKKLPWMRRKPGELHHRRHQIIWSVATHIIRAGCCPWFPGLVQFQFTRSPFSSIQYRFSERCFSYNTNFSWICGRFWESYCCKLYKISCNLVHY